MIKYWYEKHGNLDGFSDCEEVKKKLKAENPTLYRAYKRMVEAVEDFENILEKSY